MFVLWHDGQIPTQFIMSFKMLLSISKSEESGMEVLVVIAVSGISVSVVPSVVAVVEVLLVTCNFTGWCFHLFVWSRYNVTCYIRVHVINFIISIGWFCVSITFESTFIIQWCSTTFSPSRNSKFLYLIGIHINLNTFLCLYKIRLVLVH